MIAIISLYPPIPGRVLEVWNSSTGPRRIVRDGTGRWKMESSFERAGISDSTIHPQEPSFQVRLAIVESQDKGILGEDAQRDRFRAWTYIDASTSIARSIAGDTKSMIRPPEDHPYVDFEVSMPKGEGDPILLLRLYEPSPLRRRVIAHYGDAVPASLKKLNQSADIAISMDYIAACTSLPLYVSSDIYVEMYREKDGQRKPFPERGRVAVIPGWVRGEDVQGMVDAFMRDKKTILGRIALPPQPLWDKVKLVHSELIVPEARFIIGSVSRMLWSPVVRELDGWQSTVTTPFNYKLNGQILFPELEPGNRLSIREFGGLSAQSPWYHDPSKPAVEEGWILARLGEILACRGWTLEGWRGVVDRMIQGGSGPWTQDERRCLANYVRLVQIHSTTRQYNYDHQYNWSSGEWVNTDTLKRSLTAIDDCDGNAAGTYAIAMTILFPPGGRWTHPDANRVRSLAAIVGVPFGIAGTISNILDDRHGGGNVGHMYCAMIPFPTYLRATGRDGDRGMMDAFRGTFGFDAPMHHTKPAICENIYFTTPYYSDHHGASERKRAAVEMTSKFIEGVECGRHADWLWVSGIHIMGKHHSCQNHALRMFTDFESNFIAPGSGARGRSFIPTQPLRVLGDGSSGEERDTRPPLDPDALFPFYMEGYPDLPTKLDLAKREASKLPGGEEAIRQYTRVHDRLRKSRGYGLPIELLGHGRPWFTLQETISASDDVVRAEKDLIEAYEHPIVPLPARADDLFASRTDWMDEFMRKFRERMGTSVTWVDSVPMDSNMRVTVYAYDVSEDDVLDRFVRGFRKLYGDIHAAGVYVGKYGWCVACILVL